MAKLKIKHGDIEFEAEGEPEDVKAQYEAFLAFAQSAPAPPKPNVNTPPSGTPLTPDAEFSLMDRIFQHEKDGTVSLKVLPSGDRRSADALLLLLYGAHKVGGVENVFGTQLSKAAKISGVQIDRVDRTLEVHKQFYVRGGLKRGATYTLNNQGYPEAERIMKSIFP